MLKQGIVIFIFFFNPFFLHAQEKSYLFQPRGANFFIYGRGSDQFIINQSTFTLFNIHKKIRQLSSGKRIVSAADDPAGLAVAEKMDSLIRGIRREVMNAEDLKNYYAVAESAIAQDYELLKRIRVLIRKSAGVLMGPEEREINQAEIDQLLSQINMNARFSQFNTKKIIPELTTKKLGLDRVNVVHNLYGSDSLAEQAMTRLAKLRTYYGSQSNVLELQIKGKTYYYINLTESESRIRDMNMAEGISELLKNHVMIQTQYGILLREQ